MTAEGRPRFRVPVVLWVDADGGDERDAEITAVILVRRQFPGGGREMTVLLASGDALTGRVVAVDSVPHALAEGRLVVGPGRWWAEKACERGAVTMVVRDEESRRALADALRNAGGEA